MHFVSPTWGTMTLTEIRSNIEQFIKEEPNAEHKIVIGTDSQTSRKSTIFVTALIIHRVGRGGRFFFSKNPARPIFDLRYRIYKETELSLKLIEKLKEQKVTDLFAQWPLEVHVDIGQEGETKKLIQEIVGWVTSVGYEAKIKPFSFGASSVADRFTS